MNSQKIETTGATISRQIVAGTIWMLGELVATAEPAAEHMGQMWETVGGAVRSVQKWNCAPTKITERSNAKIPMQRDLTSMCLVGRSLVGKGCNVKAAAGPAGPGAGAIV